MYKMTMGLLSFIFVFSANAQTAKDDIKLIVGKYFEGYQKADAGLIKEVFHPSVHLLSIDQGNLDSTSMEDWVRNLEERQAKGDIRKGSLKLENIDIKDYAATVKLTMTFEKFVFTDYLSLLKLEGKWMIMGKIYHFQLR